MNDMLDKVIDAISYRMFDTIPHRQAQEDGVTTVLTGLLSHGFYSTSPIEVELRIEKSSNTYHLTALADRHGSTEVYFQSFQPHNDADFELTLQNWGSVAAYVLRQNLHQEDSFDASTMREPLNIIADIMFVPGTENRQLAPHFTGYDETYTSIGKLATKPSIPVMLTFVFAENEYHLKMQFVGAEKAVFNVSFGGMVTPEKWAYISRLGMEKVTKSFEDAMA